MVGARELIETEMLTQPFAVCPMKRWTVARQLGQLAVEIGEERRVLATIDGPD